MADGFSVSFVTAAFEREMRDKAFRIDRGTQWALRETGRATQRAIRKKIRVYGGANAVGIAAVKRARKAGVTLTGERLKPYQSVEAKNQVVRGLLRDSYRPSRRIKRVGPAYVLVVSPRGPRAFKYAAKIDALDHFMDAGHAAAEATAGAALAHAVSRVWR